MDSVRTRGHGLRGKKIRVRTVLRLGSFTRRVVNAWNGLLRWVMAVGEVKGFILELDRHLDAMEIEKYGDIGRTWR